MIEYCAVADRRLEIGAVEDVKGLRPELNSERLRNAPDGSILKDREIEIDEARPRELVAPSIAKQIRTSVGDRQEGLAYRREGSRCSRQGEAAQINVCEALRFEISVNGIASGQTIRVIERPSVVLAERVSGNQQGKGGTGAGRKDPAYLPTAEDMLGSH